jgi:NADH-quinone oxidoreductase subunit D
MERFGILAKASPLHSDILIIGGYVTHKTLKRIIRIYNMMPQPKFVLCLGSCPMTGGIYWDSYNTIKSIDNHIPVDRWIAGCPPRPEAIGIAISHILQAIEDGHMQTEGNIEMKKKIQYWNTNDDLIIDPSLEKIKNDESIIHFGPQHPASGNFSIKLTIKGERIKDTECVAGYLHRGIEKLCEYRGWYQNTVLISRACVFDGASYEIGYVNAIEKLLEIEIPERAKYLRVIQAELSRIQSHFLNLGFVAYSSGFDTVARLVWGDRERIIFLLEALCGGRIYQIFNIPGGVRGDVSEEFEENLPNTLSYIRNRLEIFDDLFMNNPVLRKRSANLGVISHDNAIDYDITGPNMRASGVKFDVRKRTPYAAYDKLHFDVPIFNHGDVYHRILIRRLEIEKSLNLLEESINTLPDGPIKVKLRSKYQIPEGEAISFVESARGELCFHVISDGGVNPYRIKAFFNF